MKLTKLRKKIIGKKLMTIVTLKIDDLIRDRIQKIIDNTYSDITKCYSDINTIELMIFEDNIFVAFIDMDCDGYRSGDWYIVDLKSWLDTGNTKQIKNINSVVRDTTYFEDKDAKSFLLITTDEYVIKMGQDSSDSYYPSNFFDIEKLKKAIINNKTVDGEIVDLKG